MKQPRGSRDIKPRVALCSLGMGVPLWPEGSARGSCQLSGWPPHAVPGRTGGFAPFYKECGLAVGRRRPTHRGPPGYVPISLPETTCSHGEGGADPLGPMSRGASKESPCEFTRDARTPVMEGSLLGC